MPCFFGYWSRINNSNGRTFTGHLSCASLLRSLRLFVLRCQHLGTIHRRPKVETQLGLSKAKKNPEIKWLMNVHPCSSYPPLRWHAQLRQITKNFKFWLVSKPKVRYRDLSACPRYVDGVGGTQIYPNDIATWHRLGTDFPRTPSFDTENPRWSTLSDTSTLRTMKGHILSDGTDCAKFQDQMAA